MRIKEIIDKFLKKSLISFAESQSISSEIIQGKSITIEIPKEESFGDYTCTTAMNKELRNLFQIRNPIEFAQKWIPFIKTTKLSKSELILDDPFSFFDDEIGFDDLFENVQVAGAGFLNFFVQSKLLLFFLFRCLSHNHDYGRFKKEKPRKIIFEFVSANPTGPLNVVSARASALGDSCCNLLEAIGDSVFREYYVNDYGNQVELLGISFLFRFLELKKIPLKFSQKNHDKVIYPQQEGLPFPSEAYHGEYIQEALIEILKHHPISISENEIQRLKKISQNPNLTEENLKEILNEELYQIAKKFSKLATEYFLQKHKEDLQKFRVHFENFFLESSLHESGKVFSIVEKLKNHTYEKDKKIFFKSSDFGDDQDRVIIRENGKPTYLLADIAYHYEKIQRGFDTIINIWGPDHHGYIPRMKGAMQALGFPKENFHVLIAQQVTLLENGKPIVMSKRAGKIIQMKELLEEIPIDVARYFFLMRSFESHLEFDIDEAKDTSEKNPYYYVAYSHARIHSIFRKIEEERIFAIKEEAFFDKETLFQLKPRLNFYDFSSQTAFEKQNYQRNLLLKIARYPDEVYESATSLEPHRLLYFLYQIANDLSKFYIKKENKIIEKNEEEGIVLLSILLGVKICLKNGLELLGMEAPNRLEKTNLQITKEDLL
ncbi:MAG: arginine--tRNA ligase [Leptospiraceae bacterium]|nr:arginine--tRNA ligase [Leptospiraceae bacterium]MDW7976221.1 arginine--tRNA ligase [Leptospiraceae bacterium]